MAVKMEWWWILLGALLLLLAVAYCFFWRLYQQEVLARIRRGTSGVVIPPGE